MALSNYQQHCKKQIFHIIHHCYSEIVNKTIIFEVCSHSDDMVQNVQQMEIYGLIPHMWEGPTEIKHKSEGKNLVTQVLRILV